MILGSLERYGSHPASYRAMPSDTPGVTPYRGAHRYELLLAMKPR